MIAIWEKSENLTHWSNKVYISKRLQNVNEHALCMEKSDIILWLHTFHISISQGLLIFDLHKAAFTFFPFFFSYMVIYFKDSQTIINMCCHISRSFS